MRALACLLAAALAFGALAAPARCEEELPNALRVNAEHAFLAACKKPSLEKV